mgnify:CR=1 FL=1
MTKSQLAEKLYGAGYEHREVRAVWAYAWNEQHVGRVRKRKPWELKALEEVGVSVEGIVFKDEDDGEINSYF